MPTKRELLEEKTVKELKQIARDTGLSGYSNKRKSELVSTLMKNYAKSEIESLPTVAKMARPEKVEPTEIKPIEKPSRLPVEEWEIETPEVDREEKKTESRIIGIILLIIAAALAIVTILAFG